MVHQYSNASEHDIHHNISIVVLQFMYDRLTSSFKVEVVVLDDGGGTPVA